MRPWPARLHRLWCCRRWRPVPFGQCDAVGGCGGSADVSEPRWPSHQHRMVGEWVDHLAEQGVQGDRGAGESVGARGLRRPAPAPRGGRRTFADLDFGTGITSGSAQPRQLLISRSPTPASWPAPKHAWGPAGKHIATNHLGHFRADEPAVAGLSPSPVPPWSSRSRPGTTWTGTCGRTTCNTVAGACDKWAWTTRKPGRGLRCPSGPTKRCLSTDPMSPTTNPCGACK